MGRCTKGSGGAFELFTFGARVHFQFQSDFLLTKGDLSPKIWSEGGRCKCLQSAILRDYDCYAKAMVKEFVLKYQKELNEMWETEEYIKLPPLD